MTMTTKKLTIHGRVQGVAYRAWLSQEAVKKDIHGWVKNRSDGTVEALLHGPDNEVEALIEASRNGPPIAEVTKVEIDDVDFGGPALFEIHPTE